MKLFKKLTQSFKKTSHVVSDSIKKIVTYKKLDKEIVLELEEALIRTDIGVQNAALITEELSKHKFAKSITDKEIKIFLRDKIIEIMKNSEKDMDLPTPYKKIKSNNDLNNDNYNSPYVIMMCGVNGNGKTTTVGKLAMHLQRQDYTVMLAGCDTFRAAAMEQLQEWAVRANNCPIILGEDKADAASIVYKAVDQATKQKIDILIIDTAGRLHNNSNLMDELKKSVKVLKKIKDIYPNDTILVLDGTSGQNTYAQVKVFNEAVNITGIIVTKLDSSAKAGFVVGITQQYHIPIYAVGIGENIEDLKKFNVRQYASALFDLDEEI